VSGDLWLNARGFWTYSEKPTDALFGGDEITRTLQAAPLPYRVIDLSDTGADVYPGASLMAFGIPQILGHHGNQLHHFNELLGGKNEWRYLLAGRRLWDLYAVQYVLVPSGLNLGGQLPAYADLEQDFDTLLSAVPTASGGMADLLIRREPVPYARVVQAAVTVPDDEAIPTIADSRSSLPTDRVVLLAPEAGVQPAPVTQIPEPLGVNARLTEWEPGRMTIQLEPAPDEAAYLLVSENYYPGWRVWVDGRAGQVMRGDVSLVTVPVAAGSSEVRLQFRSDAYVQGRLITWLSAAMAIALIVVPVVSERRRRA
jgi:hypothetical protein